MQNNTMCMLQSNVDINIETTEPAPENEIQVPESETTEPGPGTEIQVPESRSTTNIQIDFYHPIDVPHYRTYFRNSDYTNRETILPIAPEDQRDTVAENTDVVEEIVMSV